MAGTGLRDRLIGAWSPVSYKEKQRLTHSIFISLLSNWIGLTQPRVVRLFLSMANPISSSGKTANSCLESRRADAADFALEQP